MVARVILYNMQVINKTILVNLFCRNAMAVIIPNQPVVTSILSVLKYLKLKSAKIPTVLHFLSSNPAN